MDDFIRQRFANKSIILLGFGREGQSSYALLRKVFPDKQLTIADASAEIRENPLIQDDLNLSLIIGEGYLEQLSGFDIIFRSPGIPVWKMISPGNDFTISPSDYFPISRDRITNRF